ncbi:response regulator [Flavobacterium sp. ZT3R18]|uniref:response regulator n=1 Tax=Flavobacterium sp. ZT3R18 TaxID=2594429 RepID=UPI00117BD57E|nr:response regulator [Flavobacterium sp. ZT3R18]TRX36854.1 response regulator [Flavobacterium sp. ZT3R18]
MLDLIMCIDDDPIALMLLKKVISKAIFSKEIITAQNGEEALDFFKSLKNTPNQNNITNQPQLIFLDLNMPVMGGWEFLDLFNTAEYLNFNNIKVIILSSTIDPEDINKSKTYPIVIDFLPKPITSLMLDDLRNKI